MNIRSGLKRKRKSDMELKLLASIVTEQVTERTEEEDVRREPTQEERTTLKNIAYGALLTLNSSEYLACTTETVHAVIEMGNT